MVACDEEPDGTLRVRLDSGTTLEVDHVLLATGYKVDIRRVPFLARGNLLAEVSTRNGFPVLDERFQSSVPGLFFTSFAAAQDVGPFFGFTVSVPVATRVLGAALVERKGAAPK